jgi:ergothioneine biosynthesis protein EgtB
MKICAHLEAEDFVVQPVVDVSPPKWHLAHTTWFFETFILVPHLKGYNAFHPDYGYVFNSYYETVGKRVLRADRGNLSRPTIKDVYAYRAHVDAQMAVWLQSTSIEGGLSELLELGLQHEEQHQELLITDIKYILGHNPLFPPYQPIEASAYVSDTRSKQWISIPEGIYQIGFNGEGFSFDNEHSMHRVFLERFDISSDLVTAGEFLKFIEDGGYKTFRFWHADGWDWVNTNQIKAPMYMHHIDGVWMEYTFGGLKPVVMSNPIRHVSYYEASAFAQWSGRRLPTEFEWEVASKQLKWGDAWEWTNSAYLPYPGFKTAEGALGEYNGKFMINQMVLRGASPATAPGHSRNTYRNFFHPQLQWQFTGIRLAK